MSNTRVTVNPDVMMGKPTIRGTRIPVETLLRKMAEGASAQDLLDAYPTLTLDDVRAAIAYAAHAIGGERTVALTGTTE